jgi:hypothetical protein
MNLSYKAIQEPISSIGPSAPASLHLLSAYSLYFSSDEQE